MSGIRKFYRTILLAILLVIGIILTVIFLRNTRHTSGIANSIVATWLGTVARSLGVRIKTYGSTLPEKTQFVSNHIWNNVFIADLRIKIRAGTVRMKIIQGHRNFNRRWIILRKNCAEFSKKCENYGYKYGYDEKSSHKTPPRESCQRQDKPGKS